MAGLSLRPGAAVPFGPQSGPRSKPARGVVAGVCKAPLPGDACHVRRRAAEPRLFWPEVSFAVAGHDPDDRAPRVAVLLDRQGRLLAYVGSTDLQGLFARAARRRADWAGLC